MVMIKISSPTDIRRQVNQLKDEARKKKRQPQQQQQQNATSSNQFQNIPRWLKRRKVSTDLYVDFNTCGLPSASKIMQATDLALLLELCEGLETLSLEDVQIVGDFSLVTTALQKCASLKTFSSYACRIRSDTSDLLALGLALRHCTKLENLSMGFASMKEQPVLRILAPVVANCVVLKKIFVNGFNVSSAQQDNQDVVDFFRPLAENGAVAAAASTATQQRQLKRLIILPMLCQAFSAAHLQEIGRILQNSNSQLEVLELYLSKNTSVATLADCLQHNTSLTRLSIDGRTSYGGANRDTTLREVQAFLTLLRDHNFTLRELKVDQWRQTAANNPPPGFPWRRNPHQNNNGGNNNNNNNNNNQINDNTNDNNNPQQILQEALQGIEFYLALNRLGRAKLLAPNDNDTNNNNNTVLATTDDWMEAIANQDDVSIIYYFLRKFPSLCLPDPNYGKSTGNNMDTTANNAEEETVLSLHNLPNVPFSDVVQQALERYERRHNNGNSMGRTVDSPDIIVANSKGNGSDNRKAAAIVVTPSTATAATVNMDSGSNTTQLRQLVSTMPHISEETRQLILESLQKSDATQISSSTTTATVDSSPLPQRRMFVESPDDGVSITPTDSNDNTSNTSNNNINRKRTRDVMEKEDDDALVATSSSEASAISEAANTNADDDVEPPSHKKKRGLLDTVIKDGAIYSSIFAMGYLARGVMDQLLSNQN